MSRREQSPQTRRYTIGAALALAGLFVPTQGWAMGKLVLFSAVSGKVVLHGKPIVGARIERTYKWGSDRGTETDATTSDAAGAFKFPAVEKRSLLASLMPHQPSIMQTMTIHHEGKSYEAWMVLKQDYESNSELKGKPISLTCRLENPPEHGGQVYGICDVD